MKKSTCDRNGCLEEPKVVRAEESEILPLSNLKVFEIVAYSFVFNPNGYEDSPCHRAPLNEIYRAREFGDTTILF